MRPIDADTLYDELNERHYPFAMDADLSLADEQFRRGISFSMDFVKEAPVLDVIPVNLLKQLLMQYFCVGSDCYTYELTRVKEAYELGTMTLDDFVEWDEEQVDDLVSYIVNNVSVLRG